MENKIHLNKLQGLYLVQTIKHCSIHTSKFIQIQKTSYKPLFFKQGHGFWKTGFLLEQGGVILYITYCLYLRIMKKILYFLLSTLLVFSFIYSCSSAEETTTPNIVQTPEPETPAPTPTQYTLTVSAGEGGTISSEGGTYDEGTELSITANANEGYRFVGWEGNDSSSESLTFILNSDQTLRALFELIPIYSLTVTTSEGGTVSIDGGEFEEGTEITVIATPNEGYIFEGWDGNSDTSSEIVILIDTNISLNANFEINQTIVENNYEIYEYNQLDLNDPPFGGTIFITGEIITSTDPSYFNEIEYIGTDTRQMFDRRNGGAWINIEPHLFNASFSDGLETEIQINPEFTLEEAITEANKYAFLVGQLPTALRIDVETMWIHKGVEAYGGGNRNILVHTGMTQSYENNLTGNITEETLIHEATHTSIDSYHYPNGGWTNSFNTNGESWIEAVDNDGCYISDYARDNPYREDLAELMPLYIAVKYFPNRISSDLRDKILSCNYNRIKYLDSLNLNMNIYKD